MQSKAEKWDYIITGRPYGIMRMVIVGALAAFFIVLTIDQLQPAPNKMAFVALAFGGIATLMTVTFVKLISRYFYYKICIGQRGFYFKTAIEAHHSATSAAPSGIYRHIFHFIDRSGKKHEALYETSLYENEIAILTSAHQQRPRG